MAFPSQLRDGIHAASQFLIPYPYPCYILVISWPGAWTTSVGSLRYEGTATLLKSLWNDWTYRGMVFSHPDNGNSKILIKATGFLVPPLEDVSHSIQKASSILPEFQTYKLWSHMEIIDPPNHPLFPTSTWRKQKAEHWTPTREQHQATSSDMWETLGSKPKTKQVETFTEHISSVKGNIRFAREDKIRITNCHFWTLLCILRRTGPEHWSLPKTTHTNKNLLFDSHHLLKQKRPIVRTQHHQAENFSTKTDGKKKNKQGPKLDVAKSAKKSGNNTIAPNRGERKTKIKNVVIPHMAGVSEKFMRIFSKQNIPVRFKAGTTLILKLALWGQ